MFKFMIERIMKRIVLLLGICLCISGVYAQKFEAKTLDEAGDSYEVQIKHFDKLFGEMFTAEKVAPLAPDKEKQRDAWRGKCAGKMLTDELRQVLKEVKDKDGGKFWITFYVDGAGQVLTVKFIMSATVYIKVTTKMLKALYNLAMQEKLDPACYLFDEEHVYAVEGVDLMKRVDKE